MKRFTFCFLLFLPLLLPGQHPFSLHFQTTFHGKNAALGQPLHTPEGDSLALHTLRLYLGRFIFWKNGAVVSEEKNRYRLLDLEDEGSLHLSFDLPDNQTFDSLAFDLGVDSLTTASGVMGGDLDPTKGMFWTWQSGYINVKLEGFYEKNTAPNHAFQFHLGGYLPPFQTSRRVKLRTGTGTGRATLRLDLAAFFEHAGRMKKTAVMSPCAEAVLLSEILSKSFILHGE